MLILERSRERQKRKKGPIRTLGDGFDVADGAVLFQGDRHGTFVVWQFLALDREQAEGDAPLINADPWFASRKFRSSPIVVGDLAGGIGRVHRDRQRIENLMEPSVFLVHRPLSSFECSKIDRKAAGMNELPVFKLAARTDFHVPDRAVASPQSGGIPLDSFASLEAGEDIVDDILIDVERGNVTSDVIIGRISEKAQFGFVGMEDTAVGVHHVQTDATVFEEVFIVDCRPWLGTEPALLRDEFSHALTFPQSATR